MALASEAAVSRQCVHKDHRETSSLSPWPLRPAAMLRSLVLKKTQLGQTAKSSRLKGKKEAETMKAKKSLASERRPNPRQRL